VKGERIGVSTMEANAALRTIVRRDSGESYRAMLTRMAQESGIDTPSAEDLARFDRKRKGKTLSNADWKSPTDPDARIAKMKDGTTHLAHKPEHAVDLDTGVVVAAQVTEFGRNDRPLESVREHHAGLHSFRSMRRMEASRRKARALWLRHSQSLASRRQRPSQAKVRSTIQRLGSATKPVV
jgi:hypothetical protein